MQTAGLQHGTGNGNTLALAAGKHSDRLGEVWDCDLQALQQYGGIPPFPETQEFVRRVLVYWNRNVSAAQPTHS